MNSSCQLELPPNNSFFFFYLKLPPNNSTTTLEASLFSPFFYWCTSVLSLIKESSLLDHLHKYVKKSKTKLQNLITVPLYSIPRPIYVLPTNVKNKISVLPINEAPQSCVLHLNFSTSTCEKLTCRKPFSSLDINL